MLIHWDYSPEQLLSACRSQIQILSEELIRVKRRGIHVVSVSRRTVDWLLENVDFSTETKNQLASLRRAYAQTGNLRTQAGVYLEVSEIAGSFGPRVGNRIPVSVSCLTRSGILERPKLVVENIDNDGWLIDFIFYNVREVCGSPSYEMQLLHGGGGDALRVLTYECAQRSIVCLVADSDKKHPTAADGKKIVAARGFCANSDWPLCFVYDPPCHEVENILPFEIVADMSKYDSADSIAVMNAIIAQEVAVNCSHGDRYWRWFDIKNGLKQNLFKEYKEDAKDWHSQKLSMAKIDAYSDELDGFGGNLIPRIRDSNQLQSELRRLLNSSTWPSDLRAFFIEVAWIFAATRRSVT